MIARVQLTNPTKKYKVILADPPWFYKHGIGKRGAAVNHYPTMTIQELIDLCPMIDNLAHEHCALFCWVTAINLPESFKVIKSWGFEYKTIAFNWVKLNQSNALPFMGMGKYTRSNCELCLVATRGKPKRLNADVHQTLFAYRKEHSRKPTEQYERIQALYRGPYIELFCRGSPHPGWDGWGNQAVQS